MGATGKADCLLALRASDGFSPDVDVAKKNVAVTEPSSKGKQHWQQGRGCWASSFRSPFAHATRSRSRYSACSALTLRSHTTSSCVLSRNQCDALIQFTKMLRREPHGQLMWSSVVVAISSHAGYGMWESLHVPSVSA